MKTRALPQTKYVLSLFFIWRSPSHQAAVDNSCSSATNLVPSCATRVHVFPTNRPSSSPSRTWGGRWCCLYACKVCLAALIGVASHTHVWVCAAVSVCPYWQYWLLVGHGGMELQQPHLRQAARFRLPLTDPSFAFSEGARSLFQVTSFWEFVYD